MSAEVGLNGVNGSSNTFLALDILNSLQSVTFTHASIQGASISIAYSNTWVWGWKACQTNQKLVNAGNRLPCESVTEAVSVLRSK